MARNLLKRRIVETMEREPETRNDDVLLTTTLWRRYYSHLLITRQSDSKQYVQLEHIGDLPREDHVKRIRAKIHSEEKRLLPTRIEVARKRRIAEKDWREALGYDLHTNQDKYV